MIATFRQQKHLKQYSARTNGAPEKLPDPATPNGHKEPQSWPRAVGKEKNHGRT